MIATRCAAGLEMPGEPFAAYTSGSLLNALGGNHVNF